MTYVVVIDDRAYGPVSFEEAVALIATARERGLDRGALLAPLLSPLSLR